MVRTATIRVPRFWCYWWPHSIFCTYYIIYFAFLNLWYYYNHCYYNYQHKIWSFVDFQISWVGKKSVFRGLGIHFRHTTAPCWRHCMSEPSNISDEPRTTHICQSSLVHNWGLTSSQHFINVKVKWPAVVWEISRHPYIKRDRISRLGEGRTAVEGS